MTQTPEMTIAVEFDDGLALYCKPNEVGGTTYYSDEVGGGVFVWDTAIVAERTLLAAIAHNRGHQPADAQGLVRELMEAAAAVQPHVRLYPSSRKPRRDLEAALSKANTFLGEKP